MSDPLFINVDAGAPEYNARELRRGLAVNLFPGADRFGAREGVRPGHTAVSLSGTTWTVHNLTAVVYPGLTSTAGPYLVQHPEESAGLDPADGSNPRIDALDLQVEDDDEDASGERRSRIVYVTGIPASSPAAPALSDTSFRLATILVPAGGSPSPTLTAVHPFTVASGGILPVRDDSEYPTDGLYDGMVMFDQDLGFALVRLGSVWAPLAAQPLDVVEVTAGTAASLELAVPSGVTAVRVVGTARSNIASGRTNLLVSVNDHSGTNAYRTLWRSTSGAGVETVSLAARDNDWEIPNAVAGGNAGASVLGSAEIVFPRVAAAVSHRMHFVGGVIPSATASDARHVDGTGHTFLGDAITTIKLAPAGGSSFVAGTRFELRHA